MSWKVSVGDLGGIHSLECYDEWSVAETGWGQGRLWGQCLLSKSLLYDNVHILAQSTLGPAPCRVGGSARVTLGGCWVVPKPRSRLEVVRALSAYNTLTICRVHYAPVQSQYYRPTHTRGCSKGPTLPTGIRPITGAYTIFVWNATNYYQKKYVPLLYHGNVKFYITTIIDFSIISTYTGHKVAAPLFLTLSNPTCSKVKLGWRYVRLE